MKDPRIPAEPLATPDTESTVKRPVGKIGKVQLPPAALRYSRQSGGGQDGMSFERQIRFILEASLSWPPPEILIDNTETKRDRD